MKPLERVEALQISSMLVLVTLYIRIGKAVLWTLKRCKQNCRSVLASRLSTQYFCILFCFILVLIVAMIPYGFIVNMLSIIPCCSCELLCIDIVSRDANDIFIIRNLLNCTYFKLFNIVCLQIPNG